MQRDALAPLLFWTPAVLKRRPPIVVAVRRFTSAATPEIVAEEHEGLLADVRREAGLVAGEEEEDVYVLAQYDALFALGERRNEVWVELEDHPWED